MSWLAIVVFLQGDIWGLFSLNASGLLSLARDISEADLGTYTVTMTAEDNGATPLSGSTEVKLRVVNQTLYFNDPYNYVEIFEGSNSFIGGGANKPIPVTGNPTAAIFSPTYQDNPFNLIQSNEVGGACGWGVWVGLVGGACGWGL